LLLAGVNGDHLVVSIKDRPLIHAFAVHPRDRYHQKSVVSGVIAAFCITKDGSLLFAAVGTQVYAWLVSVDRPLTACVLDPAESRLFVGSDTGNIAQVNLYALDDRSEILIQVADEKNERVPVFNGHCDEITALSVNGDGCLLASGDSAGKYCIWEITSRQCLKVTLCGVRKHS
ncbi:WD domain, G-beta repeat protein, partial [Ancylostoma duodenale]